MKLYIVRILLLILSMAASASVHACACCGLDNTWEQYSESIPGYTADVLSELIFDKGEFSDSPVYVNSLDIIEIKRGPGRFVLRTGSGDLIFIYGKSVKQRMVDITFITNEKYELSDSAEIYHEVILDGQLEIPVAIIKKHEPAVQGHPLRNLIKASMIFQGFGNTCVEKSTFKKWLIKPANRKVNFHGSGVVKSQ